MFMLVTFGTALGFGDSLGLGDGFGLGDGLGLGDAFSFDRDWGFGDALACAFGLLASGDGFGESLGSAFFIGDG
jgi:protein crumbs